MGPRGRVIRRGRGGKVVPSGRKRTVAKPPQPAKPWEATDQKEALRKLLAILQPTKSSSQANQATVEYYYVSDIIPFVVSRIGKLATKPSTKSQLHDAIKTVLLEDPEGANAPPVDAVYLFCKLLSEGLISVSIKQEVCYFYPPISRAKEELTVPQKVEEWSSKSKQKISRAEAQQTLKQIDKKVASFVKSGWRSKQLQWKSAQQRYFEKFHKELEDTQKYQKLQPHYQRVKQWIEKILQKKKDQHTPSQESNNNNNNDEEDKESVVAIEFHTHSTSWNFLHTLIKLFRVTRKVDDQLVEDLIQAMVTEGLIQIDEEGKLRYVNKPPQKAPGVPPIVPNISSLFAPTPQAFWEHNKISIGRNNVINAQGLATLLRLVGNPSTTVSKNVPYTPPTSSKTEDTSRKEANIFASLAEEIDAATGKSSKDDEPEPEAPKAAPVAPLKGAMEKKPVDASEFTEVSSSKKKKGKREPEPRPAPVPSTPASSTKAATSVATTSAYAALAAEEDKEKEEPKKKMSSKNKKKAALAEASKTAPVEVPAPVKELAKAKEVPAKAEPKGKIKGAAKEESKPANPTAKVAKEAPAKLASVKATNPPTNKAVAPAKAPPAKGKAASNPVKPQNNDNNKPKQESETQTQQSKKKNNRKQEPQKNQVQLKRPHHKKKDVPLVPPTLIISCLFVLILILAAYYLRIDQFLDTLFD